ncbi:ATP-binding protein [Spirochaeta isovalerica]|uniref:histidine kinase n=1 Tax=Spirochaeta isovalerica TaxID=150 RepID=A0A841R6C6_9SPIO|nr:ATP-binding protein [Spirochaeta isovalerica]MBB6478717.1 PAS domain S-box-containing protein [Spirochaeta isovalerica]
MRLTYKINLFSLVIPALMALIVVLTGISVMNRVIYDLNRKLIGKDMDNLVSLIEADHDILKKAGVDDYPQYINQAKRDFLDKMSDNRDSTESRLIIIDTAVNQWVFPSPRERDSLPELERDMFLHISGEMDISSSASGAFFLKYVKIPYWDWIIILIISSEDLFREIGNYLRLVLPLSIIPVIAGLILTYFSLKNVTSRINDSLKCLNNVEKGNLLARIKLSDPKDEIDTIQHAINNMINSLHSLYTELETRVEERTEELAKSNELLKLEILSGDRARNEISYLNHYLKDIIDSMPYILIGLNRDFTINTWNPEARRVSGHNGKDIIGSNLFSLIDKDCEIYPLIKEKIMIDETFADIKGKVTIGESEEFYGEISYFSLKEQRNELGILQIRNITERVQLEELIKQSEKMLSVGGLAAGMAHEINNPLAGMMQSAQNIRRRLNLDIPANIKKAEEAGTSLDAILKYSEMRNIPEMIQSILDSGRKAAEIVDDMVTFSQSDSFVNSLFHVEEILSHALISLKMDEDFHSDFLNESISVIEEYSPDLPAIPCNEKKLEQAFYNIFRNALQVLKTADHNDPKIFVRTSLGVNSLQIEIEDNGPGIDDEIQKRVFEPFFSTKGISQGKGLGLSISYYIIKNHHGGNLWLEKSDDKGTLFIISLPLTAIRDREKGL